MLSRSFAERRLLAELAQHDLPDGSVDADPGEPGGPLIAARGLPERVVEVLEAVAKNHGLFAAFLDGPPKRRQREEQDAKRARRERELPEPALPGAGPAWTPPHCDCAGGQRRAVRQTATKGRHAGQAFYACYWRKQEGGCGFMRWWWDLEGARP